MVQPVLGIGFLVNFSLCVSTNCKKSGTIEPIEKQSFGLLKEGQLAGSDIRCVEKQSFRHQLDDVQDIGHSDEQVINVSRNIATQLKSHQVDGVRFLVKNMQSGCILAHSMGLGKTIQVVCFCDFMFRENKLTKIVCVTPLNTIQNWFAEFNLWLPEKSFNVYKLADDGSSFNRRHQLLRSWSQGGMLIIGYDLYRVLICNKKNTAIGDDMKNMLINPDVIICDEGQKIKNMSSEVSMALDNVKTQRRIILTGYPIQNNLMEYWVMVNFIRKNYLGNESEFKTLFEEPIQLGNCTDSTPTEYMLMKHRIHVLQSMVDDFIQRKSHTLLAETLPQKCEFVFFIKMTAVQRHLYVNLLPDGIIHQRNTLEMFHSCIKLFNHPDILMKFLQTSNSVNAVNELFKDYTLELLENSIKMQIFFYILKETLKVGDRLISFSQSLDTLDMIETFLHRDEQKWIKNWNYFRLDGSTSSLERQKLINGFNANENVLLFLISTKAGGLGTNLTGANRIVLFDCCWNPCNDAQAICRIYRYGQKKTCFIYRLITDCSFERKIFDRQVNKQLVSNRVVDNCNEIPYLSVDDLGSIFRTFDDFIQESLDDIRNYTFKNVDLIVDKVVDSFGSYLTKKPVQYNTFFIDNEDTPLSFNDQVLAKGNYDTAVTALRKANGKEK